MTSNQDDRPAEMPAGGEESYEQLLDDYSHLAPPAEGEVLMGHVLQITPQGVIVDVGLKQEGCVPLEQVSTPDGQIVVQPGDTIEVMVDRRREMEGYIALSHERASRIRAWDTLEKAFRESLMMSGRVLGRVKGGLSVDVGVVAFMPSTQVDVRPMHNLDAFIGQDIVVKVVKLNRRRNNVVVSRKAAMEDELTVRKTSLLDHIHEGDLVTGVVKNLTDYGAFVDLGGIDGLLHVSDMSHGRVAHPSSVLQVGQEITVKVLKFDNEKERISLGLKQVQPDPWETIHDRYAEGMKVVGRVVSVTDYGSFVELEPGVEGLIHISEMTWSRRMKHPSKVVRVGDNVESVVLEVKPKERRISLGIKQLEPDPWTTVDTRYAIGSVVEGRVRKLSDFGAFIEIEEGIDGLVHISDLSWTKRVQHPSELLKKGQVVQAVILNIDSGNRRLSLGIKQLQPDAWETFFQSHVVGDIVKGKPSRAVNFGVFVELAPGVEGLCHNTEIPPELREQNPPLPLNEELSFKVIKMNEAEKRIGLTVVSQEAEQERQRLEDYQRQATEATHQIEEALTSAEPEAEAPAESEPTADGGGEPQE
ncbi:30S ribosomal protein S1 [uncultured Paludibaculum sp.]|uniref:30S ribosomal protein S1 n=1 Tax=uncultured Paludibaculum sp. TaxID=1765020 RepID=UPI002AAB09EF|nr:30S ribosomal protein S1 [uncultured Paludibaculum sp.]